MPIEITLADKPDDTPPAIDYSRFTKLEGYAILDTPPECVFDDVAELAAAICDTAMSAVSFPCPDRQWFKAKVGLDVSQTPITQSFCAHALARGGDSLFEVRDATADPRFTANPLVTGHPHIRFYAGMPLINPQGDGLGVLCVIDNRPRPEGLTALQTRTMRTLADQVVMQLELRRTITQRDQHAAAQIATSQELRWLATHDPLTRLANRTLFHTSLREAIEADGGDNRTALLMIDLDHFKHINDTHGHEAGDRLLRAFGERLTSAVRRGDTVARLGGDEFAVILPGLRRQDELAFVLASIHARISEPLPEISRSIECRATIGAAVFPDHAADANALLRNADIALYAAKAAGRGRATMFDLEMLASNERHAAMIGRAREALDKGWITPFYQPKIDLETGLIAGFEALLRVREPGSLVGLPSSIFAAFDDAKLAGEIGAAMIERVAADMARWQAQGLDFGRVAINASAAEFRDDGFADRLLEAIACAGVPPERLELEVTETVLADRQRGNVERALRRLSEAGIRVALDDFGTGYASLSHLQRFPIHAMKVDRSLVRGIAGRGGEEVIVNALLNLGRNLGVETVAEGIETAEQAEYLRANGCRLGQGFLFHPALPAQAVPEVIAARAQLALAGNVTKLRRVPATRTARGRA